jgi:hypothetical protein
LRRRGFKSEQFSRPHIPGAWRASKNPDVQQRQGEKKVHYTRRFALGAIASAVLAGCGGGGGSAAPATDGGGSPGLPSGGTGGGTPPARSFAAFGPSVVASGERVGENVATARLSDGRAVVLWVSGREVLARFLAADGSMGAEFVAVPLKTITGAMQQPYDVNLGALAVVATADGGFALAYQQEESQPFSQQAAPWVLRARRFAADGSVLWDTLASTFAMSSLLGPSITVAGDAFVLGWGARVGTFGTFSSHLRRIDASGDAGASGSLPPPAGVGVGSPVAVSGLPDGSFVAGWQTMSVGPVIPSGHFGHFAADLTLLSQTQLPVGTGQASTEVAVGVLADGNVAVAWGGRDGTSQPLAYVQVFAPSGAAVSTRQSTQLEFGLAQAKVVPLGADFGTAWQVNRTSSRAWSSDLFLWRFDASGGAAAAPERLEARTTWWTSDVDAFTVSAGSHYDIAGGTDGHFVATFARADLTQANLYAMGR